MQYRYTLHCICGSIILTLHFRDMNYAPKFKHIPVIKFIQWCSSEGLRIQLFVLEFKFVYNYQDKGHNRIPLHVFTYFCSYHTLLSYGLQSFYRRENCPLIFFTRQSTYGALVLIWYQNNLGAKEGLTEMEYGGREEFGEWFSTGRRRELEEN